MNGMSRKALKRRADYPSTGSNQRYNGPPKKKRKPGLKELVGNACMDCGETYHARGDSRYNRMSFATRKLKEAKGVDLENSDDDESIGQGAFFPPGSKLSKGKWLL